MEAQAFTPPDTAVEQDDDDEINVEIAPYPDWADEDEQRRAYIVEKMGLAEYGHETLIEAMQNVFDWMKSGTTRKPKLKAVK